MSEASSGWSGSSGHAFFNTPACNGQTHTPMPVSAKISFFGWLVLHLGQICAQSGAFSRYYDPSGWQNNNGTQVELLPHGYAFTTLHYCNPAGNSPLCTTFSLTDESGELQYEKTLTGLRVEGLRFHPADSTFLFWGDFATNDANDPYAIFLLKTDFHGDTRWRLDLNAPQVDYCRQTLERPDGSIFLTASNRWSTNADLVIAKVSAGGHLLWIKHYDNGFDAYDANDIIAWAGNSILVSAHGVGYDVFVPNVPDAGVALFQLNDDGQLLWDTLYRTTSSGTKFRATLTPLPDDRLALISGYEPPGAADLPSVVEVRADHTLGWSFAKTYGFYLSGTDAGPGGQLTGAGTSARETGNDLVIEPWIFRLSAQGALLWERFIPDSIGYAINAIRSTPDGGFVAVGVKSEPVASGQMNYYTWLLKLDGNGCLQPGCDSLRITAALTGPPLPGGQNGRLRLMPNPASAAVRVELGGEPTAGLLQVTAASGQLVWQQAVSGPAAVVPLEQVPDGVYWVRMIIGVRQQTAKLVVTH